MSRRQLLGAAGAASIGAGAIWGLATADGLLGDPTSIVYAMARDQPGDGPLRPRTKDVPAKWYRQLSLAFDTQEELATAGLSSLVGTFVKPGDYDDPTASIGVHATDDGIYDRIKDLSRRVSIDLSIVDEIPPTNDVDPDVDEAAQVPDLNREGVRSGYLCSANGWYGTLAPALRDERDGSRYFATSNHLYGEGGAKATEHAGEPLFIVRDGETRRIGEVVRGYPRADVVQVAPANGYRPVSAIGRMTPGTVIGYYTKVGLADLMARGERLQKVGALSGHTAGKIKGVAGITCYAGKVCKPGQLKWGDERTIIDGDSGSMSFHADPEHPGKYVLVTGFNNARTWWPGMNFSWGTAVYHLHDEYGLHF